MRFGGVLVLVLALGACGDDDDLPGPDVDPDAALTLAPLFVTEPSRSCVMASPVEYTVAGGEFGVLTVAMDGLIQAFDPRTGVLLWSWQIEAPAGQTPIVLSTPVVHGEVLFVAWQNTLTQPGLPNQGSWPRVSHQVAGFDLAAHGPHADHAPIELTASLPTWDGGVVDLESNMQLQRGRLEVMAGHLYVPMGNGPSIQPFHGWMFELDVTAWTVTARMVTTAEKDCAAGGGLLDTMVCGGGVWTPAGPLFAGDGDIFVPTGNGRVNLAKRAYANSLLRMRAGLAFEPGCDDALCADFDELAPSHECLESCTHLFVPRIPEGDPPFQPDHGKCDGKTLLECYGVIDGDFGASAPVLVPESAGLPSLLAHPGKDGALYLIDRQQLGRLYARLQLIEACGAPGDPCKAGWAGQFVTQPVATVVDGRPRIVVAGFAFDETHPAGVVAVDVVVADDAPSLEVAWQFPDFATPEALTSFRRHPGRPLLFGVDWQDPDSRHLALVEVRAGGGILWILDVVDGQVAAKAALVGEGARYSLPLYRGGVLYVGTCSSDSSAGGRLEAFSVTRR